MAYNNLDAAFKAIIGYEGKYTNDPRDPGGPTKFGVTLKTLEGWRGQTLTADDVKAMGIDEAKQIFASQYWDKVDASNLPSGVDFTVVDCAYNAGVGQAVKILQRLLQVRVDGIAGAITTSTAASMDPAWLIKEYATARLAFLKSLKGWSTYKNGWTKRVFDVQSKSLALAAQIAPDRAVGGASLNKMPGTKADKQQSAFGTAAGKSKVASAVGLIGSQASSTAENLTPYTDTFEILKYLFVALMVVGIGAGFYATVQRLKEEDPQ